MNVELISLQRHHIADRIFKARNFDLSREDIGYVLGAAVHTFDAGRTLTQVQEITALLRKRLEDGA